MRDRRSGSVTGEKMVDSARLRDTFLTIGERVLAVNLIQGDTNTAIVRLKGCI